MSFVKQTLKIPIYLVFSIGCKFIKELSEISKNESCNFNDSAFDRSEEIELERYNQWDEESFIREYYNSIKDLNISQKIRKESIEDDIDHLIQINVI